jgi:hypothetical protein
VSLSEATTGQMQLVAGAQFTTGGKLFDMRCPGLRCD